MFVKICKSNDGHILGNALRKIGNVVFVIVFPVICNVFGVGTTVCLEYCQYNHFHQTTVKCHGQKRDQQKRANDPDNRHMVKFDGFNEQQAAFRVKVQELAKLRRENMALIYGEYIPVKTTDDTLHFKRIYMGQVVDVVLSLSSESSISIDGNKVWSIQ